MSAIAIIAGAAFRKAQRLYGGGACGAGLEFLLRARTVDPLADVWMGGLIGYLGGVLASLGVFDGVRQVFGRIRVEEGEKEAMLRLPRHEFAKAVLGLVPLAAWGGSFRGISTASFLTSGASWALPSALYWAGIDCVCGRALPFDTMHAISTAVFLVILYGPWMRKLARIKKKYALLGG